MNFTAFCGKLAASLVSTDIPLERYALIAGCLGEYFGVNGDGVSLFPLDKERMMLIFTWPETLTIIGNIPYHAKNCLVASTAVTRQATIDNKFASTPHLFIYEHFFPDKSKRIPIQKIMSSPILMGDQLKGVVQISRKGVSLDAAGADFTEKDLKDLAGFAHVFAGYL
jgi:hypothetical protein